MEIQAAALLFKTLSEEVRLRMLALLVQALDMAADRAQDQDQIKDGELCVCDIMAVLRLPQSTASRHLTHLKNAGLVAARRKGAWMYYRLADDTHTPWLSGMLRDLVGSCSQAARDRTALAEHLARKAEGC